MKLESCPGCRAPVHPLLGQAPLVLSGRVVICCSPSCRAEVQAAGPDPVVSRPSAPLPSLLTRAPTWSEEAAVPEAPVVGEISTAPVPVASTSPSGHRPGWAMALASLGAALLVVAMLLPVAHGEECRISGRSSGGTTPLASAAPLAVTRVFSERSSALGLGATLGPVSARAVLPAPPSATPTPRVPILIRARRLLVLALERGSDRARRLAAEVLAEQGHSAALAQLRKAAKSNRWTIRQHAAVVLTRLGQPVGLSALRRDLSARRKPVKWYAALALARLGKPQGLTILRALSVYRHYRITAHEALARLGVAKSRRYLRRQLAEGRDPYTRLRSAVALAMAGDPSGKALLQTRLRAPGLHFGVVLALYRLGDPAARAALTGALEHTALRVEASRALAAGGHAQGLAGTLAPLLDSSSNEARLTAAASIVILRAIPRGEGR